MSETYPIHYLLALCLAGVVVFLYSELFIAVNTPHVGISDLNEQRQNSVSAHSYHAVLQSDE